MDPGQHYDLVAEAFTDLLAQVTDWSAPTPCEDWDARALVAHVIDTHGRVLSRLDGSEPSVVTSGQDLSAAWSERRACVVAALGDDRADRVVQGLTGEVPWSTMVDTLLCADTLLHSWDLAQALGQDAELDPHAAQRALAFLSPFGDGMRSPGGFGAEIAVAADASTQDRLLGFTGRAPKP